MRRLILATLAAVCAGGQPLIQIADSESPVVIGYGDMRFTDPKETDATNPKVRKWLVDQVAAEKPVAILLGGDVPWHGQEAGDYAQYDSETAPWRTANIFVSVALGNHELNGNDKQKCLENWWTAFPKLRNRRWYSAAIGSRMYVLNLDTNSSMLQGSDQMKWIQAEVAALKSTVKFVFFNLHHPPVADLMPEIGAEHNPRPNEIALADFLKTQHGPARFVVVAGHIHNYERFLRDGTVYLVSGGGGAKPRVIRRGPDDLYKNPSDVNYHYVKFVLHGDRLDAEMVRVVDPKAKSPKWEVRDRFSVTAR
ncbi:MAG TPA: metallophosphoesterase [Bryobacteraceae bacterium]|nr:metallophosphoesterase [Bryobacteraceae bacterium]